MRLRRASSSGPEKGRSCAISRLRLDTGAPIPGSETARQNGPDPSSAVGPQLLLGHVQVDGEFDVVADHGGGGIGPDAEVFAVDGGGSRVAGMRLLVHSRHRTAGPLD